MSYHGLHAHGIVFPSNMPPLVRPATDGTWQVTIAVLDRDPPPGMRGAEAWKLIWGGPDAQAWWTQHGHCVRPGQPLQVHLKHLSMNTIGHGHGAMREHKAHVISLDLAPTAPTASDARAQREAA